MRIISVIEVVDNCVLSLVSFGIFEEQLSDEVVSEAEKLFVAKAKDNGFLGDEDTIVEDGTCKVGNYTINLVWSDI